MPACHYWFSGTALFLAASFTFASSVGLWGIKGQVPSRHFHALCVVGVLLAGFAWRTAAVQEQQSTELQKNVSRLPQIVDVTSAMSLLGRQIDTDERALAVRDALVRQWQKMKFGLSVQERLVGKPLPEDRLAAAYRILDDFELLSRNLGTVPFSQGDGLVLQIAPNTFRITFPVPMARAPNVVVGDAPSGAKPETEEVSTVGCTIVFKPLTAAVSLQEFLALHPAFSADF